MVINGSCSTNMCARQLSFNFSSKVWGGAWPRGPPLDLPLNGDICVKIPFDNRQQQENSVCVPVLNLSIMTIGYAIICTALGGTRK